MVAGGVGDPDLGRSGPVRDKGDGATIGRKDRLRFPLRRCDQGLPPATELPRPGDVDAPDVAGEGDLLIRETPAGPRQGHPLDPSSGNREPRSLAGIDRRPSTGCSPSSMPRRRSSPSATTNRRRRLALLPMSSRRASPPSIGTTIRIPLLKLIDADEGYASPVRGEGRFDVPLAMLRGGCEIPLRQAPPETEGGSVGSALDVSAAE